MSAISGLVMNSCLTSAGSLITTASPKIGTLILKAEP